MKAFNVKCIRSCDQLPFSCRLRHYCCNNSLVRAYKRTKLFKIKNRHQSWGILLSPTKYNPFAHDAEAARNHDPSSLKLCFKLPRKLAFQRPPISLHILRQATIPGHSTRGQVIAKEKQIRLIQLLFSLVNGRGRVGSEHSSSSDPQNIFWLSISRKIKVA